MSSKGNTFENEVLALVLQNANIANVGDATGLRGSSTAGSLYLALHTADPGEGGSQTTSEAAYTSYARTAIARDSSNWTVSGNQGSNTNAINCPMATGGSANVTHWSIGTSSSGTGKILWKGPCASGRKAFTAATSDTLTIPGNAFLVDDQVVCYAHPGATLPTGITEGVTYWVKTSSGDSVTLSATQGGSTLDITAAGAGVILKLSPLAVSVNITPQFAAGALTIIED